MPWEYTSHVARGNQQPSCRVLPSTCRLLACAFILSGMLRLL